ncbi:hypothetical protein HOY80DRAFT_1069399 [Tuber brumale]|nr:hypothetical protein HOY80DRAFT_1069399 [Tuber brumale]
MNPRGITSLGIVGESLPEFLGSFRGGRNECFTYGIDKERRWYDYDLTSCYATIMSMCQNPNYLSEEQEELNKRNLIRYYIYKQKDSKNSNINIKAKKTFDECFNGRLLEDLQDQKELSVLLGPSYLVGNPDYNKIQKLNPKTNLDKFNFKKAYSALRVKFNLPDLIKYPPIPVNLNENLTIYPLNGETLITGLEYLSAKNILNDGLIKMSDNNNNIDELRSKYYIKVVSGTFIPFENNPDSAPFYNTIDELQANRRLHKNLSGKGSAMERIYKDLGNMLYGKVVCGISNKRSFDSRKEMMKSMVGNELANPIIGAWITGFVRSLLAELLNNVFKLGGNVTAVTTDGFVCDIPDLENKIINSIDFNPKTSFLQDYRNIREKLSGDPSALEIKTNVFGMIQ